MERPGELQQSENKAMMAVKGQDEKSDVVSETSNSPPTSVDVADAKGDIESGPSTQEPKKFQTAREWSIWRKITTVAFVATFAFLRYVWACEY
jgi:hypothetical protein